MRSILGFLALLLAAVAWADGIAVGLNRVSLNGMPTQRALIKWRGGEETMIVQSYMRGPAGTYAWIVPIPSKPSKIGTTSGYVLGSLAGRLRPRPFLDPSLSGFSWCLGLLLLALGLYGIKRPERRRVPLLILALVGVGAPIAYLFAYMSVPVGGAAAGAVSKLMSEDVGDYHVDVVRSSDPAAMTSWLKQRDGSIGSVARAAIRNYVGEGWCFAVATLKHEAMDDFDPEPLALTFASKGPVYPMRLTGGQGGTVSVDLYVLADGSASTPLLGDVRSRRVLDDEISGTWIYDDEYDFKRMAWKGATLTGMRGTLKPSQMGNDLLLAIGPPENVGLEVMTRTDWIRCVAGAVAVAVGLGVFAAALIACIARLPAKRAALLAAVAALAFGGFELQQTCIGVKPTQGDLVVRDSGG